MSPSEAHPAQRRTVAVLAAAQIFVGLGNGLAIGVGSLYAAAVTGHDEFGGFAATLVTLGGAMMSGPLARLAGARGRRMSLSLAAAVSLLGTLLLIFGGILDAWWIAMPGFLVLGASSAFNLQARFAAVDLASPRHRGRDMSIVIWMTTIGVVIGPLLVPVGDALFIPLGLPPLTGAYCLAALALAIILTIIVVFLRPDPLLTAGAAGAPRPAARIRFRDHPGIIWTIVIIGAAHATMVGVMAMTPVHLEHEGQSLQLIMLSMSSHTAGMYVLSPLFGVLADRIGRRQTIGIGAAVLAASLAANLTMPAELGFVGLALLGFGWSAATVAGSALLNDLAPVAARPFVQGRADAVMGYSGAAAGLVAGPIVTGFGFGALNIIMIGVVALIVFATMLVRQGAGGPAPEFRQTPERSQGSEDFGS